ncbi:MAG: TonB family protein [Alphaproteobacteria bacterium]|nr:TonB family protein [Alphaproteobacteria bacterium]
MNQSTTGLASQHRVWPRGALWVGAAVVAASLHIGGVALAAWFLSDRDEGEGLGRAGAEFAVELASPDVPNLNMPEGPESQASEESRAQPEHREDPPEAVPEKSDEADQVAAPEEKKPEEKPTLEMPSAADSAPRAMEVPKLADKVKASNPGLGKDDLKLTAAWGRKISAYLSQHLRYPNGKKDRRVVTVGVHLVLNRRGNVISVEVVKSSGEPAFDEAALAMVRRSDPVPAPPVSFTQDEYSFNLPVVFRPSN